jgi:hypothetical protein
MSRGRRDDAGKRVDCMTEQRDWKKDMELMNGTDGWEFEPTFDGVGNIFDDSGRIAKVGVSYAGTIFNAFEALKYWLQQYAAEKERADKANEGYRLLRKLYDEQCSEKMGYYNEMVIEKERIDKTIKELIKLKEDVGGWLLTEGETCERLDKILSTLYSKEETKGKANNKPAVLEEEEA